MILSVTRIRRSTGSCGGVTSAIRRIGWPAACRICSPSALKDDSTRSPVFALVRIPGQEYFCVRKYRYSSAQTRSGTRSDLFPAKTVGIGPASLKTAGIQYSSRARRLSSFVASYTSRTPWAPLIAVSCTPLYPFCPRTSQICRTISTSARVDPRFRLRFETFVPTVVMKVSKRSLNLGSTLAEVEMVLQIWDVLGQKGYSGVQETAIKGVGTK